MPTFYLSDAEWLDAIHQTYKSPEARREWWSSLGRRFGFNPDTVEFIKPGVFEADLNGFTPKPALKPSPSTCPRCGRIHPGVHYQPFTHRVKINGQRVTHWAWCPSTGEPLLATFDHRDQVVIRPCPEDPFDDETVCPECAMPTTADASDDGSSRWRFCEWCGWDNVPRCEHGVREDEFCAHCPDGGV